MKMKILSLLLLIACSKSYAQRPAADELQTGKGVVSIQPVEHASLVLTVNKKVIYVDPSGIDFFKGIAAPDMILITDIHGDHFDTSTLAALKKAGTILIAPPAVAENLPAAEKAGLVVLKNGEKTTQLGVTIMAIPMYNLPEDPNSMHTKGRGNGYVLTIGGKKIYISGDTQGIPEMRSLKDIDVAFVCMNLPYTMDVKEAADAVLEFKPKVVYAYHYRGKGGFSDVNEFKRLVEAGNKAIEVRLRNWYPG